MPWPPPRRLRLSSSHGPTSPRGESAPARRLTSWTTPRCDLAPVASGIMSLDIEEVECGVGTPVRTFFSGRGAAFSSRQGWRRPLCTHTHTYASRCCAPVPALVQKHRLASSAPLVRTILQVPRSASVAGVLRRPLCRHTRQHAAPAIIGNKNRGYSHAALTEIVCMHACFPPRIHTCPFVP